MSHDTWKRAFKAKRGFQFLRFLNANRVEYMIIGGAALAFHGIRDTDTSFADIDVMISPSRSNAERFANAMNSAAAASGKLVQQGFDPNRMAQIQAKFAPDSDHLEIEFVTMLRASAFAEALKRSVKVSIEMLSFYVIGLADLLAMKEAAANDQERFARDVAAEMDLLRRAGGADGKFDFSEPDAPDVPEHAKRFIALVNEAHIPVCYSTNRFRMEGNVHKLNWALPLEALFAPDEKSLERLRNVLALSLGEHQSAAQTGIIDKLKPNSKFRLTDNADFVMVNIASSPEYFDNVKARSRPGLVLGYEASVLDFEAAIELLEPILEFRKERTVVQMNDVEKIREALAPAILGR